MSQLRSRPNRVSRGRRRSCDVGSIAVPIIDAPLPLVSLRRRDLRLRTTSRALRGLALPLGSERARQELRVASADAVVQVRRGLRVGALHPGLDLDDGRLVDGDRAERVTEVVDSQRSELGPRLAAHSAEPSRYSSRSPGRTSASRTGVAQTALVRLQRGDDLTTGALGTTHGRPSRRTGSYAYARRTPQHDSRSPSDESREPEFLASLRRVASANLALQSHVWPPGRATEPKVRGSNPLGRASSLARTAAQRRMCRASGVLVRWQQRGQQGSVPGR
ncbi:MAG: hypothetical protein QOC78_3515 [Solirubrobacteraceae bacterium]|jgi:hypothetical protein|nr:hypothetical protein [Solirubrobacteraceae bacterium]